MAALTSPTATRRTFLLGSMTALAACRHAPASHMSSAPAPARDPIPTAPGAREVAAAERLVGVTYTPAERQQMVDGIEAQLKLLQHGRGFERANALAPACVFDPRLPGRDYGPRRPSFRPGRGDPGPLPADERDIAFAPVTALSGWIQRKRLTATRLTELYLARLESVGRSLDCVVTLTRERALAQAAKADAEIARGKLRGPLHGIPWGAKDLLDTARIETSWGAEPYRGRIPTADAAVVRRLDEAGAILVAKLSMGALAYGDIWYGGRTNNPWNLEEGSSGSSAGSAAATAAGLVGFAIGTETLGSIISPSMRCGTTGLRPTFGRVSRAGAMALCWSLDKIGPLARTVEDCALVLQTLNGFDRADPGSLDMPFAFDAARPLAGLRVGHDPKWFEGEGAIDLDRKALELTRATGVELVEVSLPELPYDSLLLILFAEAAAAFEELTLSGRDDELAWQEAEAWPNTFRLARFIPAIDLIQADRLRRRVMQALDDAFAEVDVIISPSYADPMLLATNFTGHPSLTLRAGFQELETRLDAAPSEDEPPSASPAATSASKHRVPHGLTLWGRLFDEGTLCRVGMGLEAALDVWAERPPLS